MTPANDLQDAEIDRILKAFRLDAYVDIICPSRDSALTLL